MFIYNVKINGGLALKIIIILLSLFMLIVFGISVYRIFFTNGKFEVEDRIMKNEITEIDAKNYTNILEAVHKDSASYIGMTIKFTGYIYRVLDFKENQFVLARDMIINEQGTQSVVVGFLAEYKDAKNFKNGDWVELTGVIKMGTYHNKEIPILKVTNLTLTLMPENPFVSMPDNAYIPTNGLL